MFEFGVEIYKEKPIEMTWHCSVRKRKVKNIVQFNYYQLIYNYE